MYRTFFIYIVLSIFVLPVFSQNIGIGTVTPNNNAVLDIQSLNKGILIPRMDSTTRKQIPNVPGLLVYDSTTKTLWQNNGAAWENYYVIPKGIINGDMLFWSGTQWVRLPASTAGKVLTVNGAGLPEWQAPAPILHSISITPLAPVVTPGQTQQFSATGIYWDSSTANITTAVTWSSSNAAVATINSSGLATCTGLGSTIITASSGVISASTTLGQSIPAISINDISQAEGTITGGTTTFNFTVILSNSSAQTITVNYSTTSTGGTASPVGISADYTPVTGQLTFSPGQTSKIISVTINADSAIEPNENFFVNLSGAVNAAIADSQAQGIILNDD
jgi:Calx-beta domain/Bacterial Ig-like domain (group 2)